MKYRVLIVDDEAPAREKIAQYLGQYPATFDIVQASHAADAIGNLEKQNFDLMFLDIQMPQMDAFEFLKKVGLDACPPIIFSTAYNQYALQAFEVHAIDYLLKPYDFDRFEDALQRVLTLIDQKKYPHQVLELALKDWKSPKQNPDIIWVNQGSKLIPLEVSSIEFLESDGNYVGIYSASHKYMLKQSLGDLHAKLDQHKFIRVHRSFVVNKMLIQEMYPKSHGDLFALLKSGKKIPISRRYRDQLMG